MTKVKLALLVVALVVAALGATVFFYMQRSMYRLGSVALEDGLRGPLEPPTQTDADIWQVEEDIELAFEAHGEGRPVLVVHGGPGVPYAEPWRGLATLANDFRFLYYHQRGSGDSTRPFDRFDGGSYYSNLTKLENTLGIGAQLADIERIRRILGQEKLILIGHSFGGFLATLYAAEFPEHVEKLVLVSPAGVLTTPKGERDLFAQARERLPSEDVAAYDELLDEYLSFGSVFSKSDAELAALHARLGVYLLAAMGYDESAAPRSVPTGGWSVFALYFSLGRAPNFTSALARVKAETLIVYGVDDALGIPGAKTYAAIPGAKVVSVGAKQASGFAGHFVFDDDPRGFAEVMDAFLGPAN